jgi:hypothetical protein
MQFPQRLRGGQRGVLVFDGACTWQELCGLQLRCLCVQVRAYGLFLQDVVQRLERSASARGNTAARALRLVEAALCAEPQARPSFERIADELADLL